MKPARPVKLRHSHEWGASVPNDRSVERGHLIIIQTRSGVRRLAEVRQVIHRAEGETIVSLSSPGKIIPKPKKAT